ncbi:MAG: radical SAM protein [Thermoguttaceae bacterium]
MKILLVLPAAEHLRVTGDEVPRRKMLRFNLSLTTVAALTPPEHEVVLCDENVQRLDFDAVCDVVGVSFMTALAPRAYEIAAEFRRRGKTVVAGGFHPTFCPDEASQHFDAVVVGEAEGLWPSVLEDIAHGRLARIYRTEQLPDLAATPIPRRELMAGSSRHYVTTYAVQTGRGCRHGCKFCSITAFARGTHRSRPLAHVLDELTAVPRCFMFVDDNIIADPEYAKQLFRAMAPMKKRWISQCSLKIADDPELLSLAYAAGCRGVFVGIETLSQQNLDAVEKGFNDGSGYMSRIAAIRAVGIGVQAGMIVGLDGDDPTVFQRTLRFLQTAHIDALQLAILTPQPGTVLYDDFKRVGRIVDHDWRHYDYRHVVITPAKMTAEQLQEGADWLYRQFYRLDRIILRTIRTAFGVGLLSAYLTWRLNLTYRYDNLREGIVGRNPAQATNAAAWRRVRNAVLRLSPKYAKRCRDAA